MIAVRKAQPFKSRKFCFAEQKQNFVNRYILPQQFLYFLPLPQVLGCDSFIITFDTSLSLVAEIFRVSLGKKIPFDTMLHL